MQQVPPKTKPSLIANLPQWAYVEQPQARGVFKVHPEDFKVSEQLGFELSGEGEHLWLYVEKRDLNTLDLCKAIAEKLNVLPKKVAYAGLKDKQAITQQWLSICTAKDVDCQALTLDKARVLIAKRHTQKLKRGAHRANNFEIIVRDISQQKSLEQALGRIEKYGVPNYFGEQRFGRSGNNVRQAELMFAQKIKVSRQQRGLYLSAARAYLFNEVLSERVKRKAWNIGLEGDVMMLAGTNSFFQAKVNDEALAKRLFEFDIHPSVPLWGKGKLATSCLANSLENEIINKYPQLTAGLESYGLRQQRRASRLIVQDLELIWMNRETLKLKFSLPKGTFATTVLRELLTIETKNTAQT